jgi:hypothetical protein
MSGTSYTPISALTPATSVNGTEIFVVSLPQPGNLTVPYVTESVTLAQIANFRSGVYTVSTLPASPGDGQQSFVSDSTAAASGNFGAAVTGGGSNHVPVYFDGGTSTWRIG